MTFAVVILLGQAQLASRRMRAMLHPLFQDRTIAGRQLAHRLVDLANWPAVTVLALPRGGVPVAREIANALNAPLDVFVVRHHAVAGNDELAVGASGISRATVILVDDGITTGARMHAAVTTVRELGAGRVIVAAPVMSAHAYRVFSSYADRCECIAAPPDLHTVREYYVDFHSLSDAEVKHMLPAPLTAV
jgi:putative phosphoribosyl transferase